MSPSAASMARRSTSPGLPTRARPEPRSTASSTPSSTVSSVGLWRRWPMSDTRLSVALPTYAAEAPEDWNHLFALARAADSAGVDRVVVSDHVVFGENLDAYGR